VGEQDDDGEPLLCEDCDAPLENTDDIFGDDTVCEECMAARSATDILEEATEGKIERAHELLLDAGQHLAGNWDNLAEQLIVEAYDAQRRGDHAAMMLALHQCARPKFKSAEDCARQYATAMAEKRARENAA